MIATIAEIAAIAGKCFPYDRYDRCDHWIFFFSAITTIITTIWKPGFTDDVSCCESFEKWMIHRFRSSQKVWTKFVQNLHQYHLFVYFFFSCNQFKLRQKALKNYLYKRILKTAKLSQNKILRSSNLTGVETPKVRLFRSTSTGRKWN